MSESRETRSLSMLFLGGLSLLNGCAAPMAEGATGEETELPPGFEFTISGGQEDVKNRYSSVVMVGGERGLCSGVMMTPSLVLTAAHCLCLPVAPAVSEQHIDSSNCAANVTVMTHTYKVEAGPMRPVTSNPRLFQGVALVYPGFKAVLQPNGVASFEGDLAVVRLEEPAPGVKIDHALPSMEVEIDDALTMVGFGETGPRGRDEGRRRFGRNVVTNIVLESGGNGVFGFRALGAHSQAGDSGGPCFREDKKGKRWVVGINSGNANGGTISLYTSTFHYRAWITEQIRKAKSD